MKDLVERLAKEKKTIATMESCTGGGVVNAITSIEGASEVISFSAVTYSNNAKMLMGVSSEVIDEFSVYSRECADEMSRNVAFIANSDFGVGVTGKLNRVDVNNPFGEDNVVFISVYDWENKRYYNSTVEATLGSRSENKDLVIDRVIAMVNSALELSDEFVLPNRGYVKEKK